MYCSKMDITLYQRRFPTIWLQGIVTIFLALTLQSAAIAWIPPIEQNFSDITQELNIASGLETNRTLGDRITLRGIHTLIYHEQYHLQTGISFNTETHYVNALFIELGYRNIYDTDFGINLKFLGNQYKEYSRAANSILPYLTWDNSLYFIECGLNYRFLNTNENQLWNIFYYDSDVTEVIVFYRFGRRFSLADGQYEMSIEANNGDAMYLGNLGAYGIFINSKFHLNEQMVIYGNIGFRQSGSIALTATNYKTYIFCGLEVQL